MDLAEYVLWIFYAALVVITIQIVRLFFADADLTLLWKAKFGLKVDSLAGKVAWITGASSGIGESLAYELVRGGCKLVLSARRREELERVKQQCLVSGRVAAKDIMVLPLDMLDFDSHCPAVEKVLDHFKRLDILVNNAGRSQRAWAAETDLSVQRQIVELNLMGPISLTKAVLPHFIENKRGHLVVTSSIAGKLGAPFSAGYCASKFALHGWYDTLRMEMVPNNILITLVCPGPVFSEVTTNAFTEKPDKVHGIPMQPDEKRVTTERCAELIALAMANKLDEVWIGLNPVLFFTYMSQYCPDIARIIAKRVGMKIAMKLREGKL